MNWNLLNSVSRKALEMFYIGVCDVILHEKVVNPTTKRTEFTETTSILGQPCRLSFSSPSPTSDGEVAKVVQQPTLFLSPDVVIPSGSKIIVTQNGRTTTYTNASETRLYGNHQEIALELFKGWA